jgi:hypothetical protein
MDEEPVIVNRIKYCLHQTPPELAKRIIDDTEWENGEKVMEPFAGDGAFYDNLPDTVSKYKTEIQEGLDFRNFDYENVPISTVITNPPFKLMDPDGIERNAFFKIIEYYTLAPHIKRIILLCSSVCYNSLTPSRMFVINSNGFYLNKVTACCVKKWYGRYWVLVFTKNPNPYFKYYLETY